MVAGEPTVPEVASSQRNKHGCLTSETGQELPRATLRDMSADLPISDVTLRRDN